MSKQKKILNKKFGFYENVDRLTEEYVNRFRISLNDWFRDIKLETPSLNQKINKLDISSFYPETQLKEIGDKIFYFERTKRKTMKIFDKRNDKKMMFSDMKIGTTFIDDEGHIAIKINERYSFYYYTECGSWNTRYIVDISKKYLTVETELIIK